MLLRVSRNIKIISVRYRGEIKIEIQKRVIDCSTAIAGGRKELRPLEQPNDCHNYVKRKFVTCTYEFAEI